MKKWTKNEDKLLKEAVASQPNLESVCKALGLSEYLVKKRMRELSLDFKKDEIKLVQVKQVDKGYRQKFEEAVVRITALEKEREANLKLNEGRIETYKIESKGLKGESEATAVALLSDWHFEEVIQPQSVNYLNVFNERVAEGRILSTFQTIVKYIKLHQKETQISQLIMALLGDFISAGIHDELKEGNSDLPINAIWKVQNHIASGIKFILENTDVSLVIPCSPGNHSRITEKQRVATEHGNSLEWLMYMNLQQYFANNKRVEFIVNEGYHTYVDVYGYTLRFHHGHSMRFMGGVGGIYIPVNKAINQWNKAKKADLDCFGHFHQMKDGGTFISNGSLIGWNSYAIKIKADFEKPKQAFFLVDKKYFVNCVRPIVLNGH
jgi:hypothetical protein